MSAKWWWSGLFRMARAASFPYDVIRQPTKPLALGYIITYFAGLKANVVKVQNLGVNDATTGTLRPYISCSYEANITSSTTFSTYVKMVMAGTVSVETTYLFALRVG